MTRWAWRMTAMLCVVAMASAWGQDGATLDLQKHKGRSVLLEIGVPECPRAPKKLRRLDVIAAEAKKHPEWKLDVVFLLSGATPAELKAYGEKHPVSVATYADPDMKLAKSMDFEASPTFYLIDPWGRVRYEGCLPAADMAALSAELQMREPPEGGLTQDAEIASVGSKAPTFKLPRLNGETFSLADEAKKHKALLLVFSDDKCPFCQNAFKRMKALAKKHKDDELGMAIVQVGPFKGPGEKMYKKQGLADMVLLDTSEELADFYQVPSVPTALLIKPDLTVAARQLYSEHFEGEVAKAFGSGAEPKQTKPAPRTYG